MRQELNFRPLTVKPLQGHLWGMRQRIVLLEAEIPAKASGHALMLEIFDLLRPMLPASQFCQLDELKLNPHGGVAGLQLLAALNAGLQEGASGVVVEHPVIRLAPQDAQRNVVRVLVALPTISPELCIQPLSWLLKFVADYEPGNYAGARLNKLLREIDEMLNRWRRLAPGGQNNREFIRAAYGLGIPHILLPGDLIQYGYCRGARLFSSSMTDETPAIGVRLARDKVATNRLFRMLGIPVPEQIVIASESEVISVAERLGYPVVVKPADMDAQEGVHPNLRNGAQVLHAFRETSKLSRRVLLEKHVFGTDYRINITKGMIDRAEARLPACVTGDGRSSISELVRIKNTDPARGNREFHQKRLIVVNDETSKVLAEQGMDLNSVPEAGREVQLSRWNLVELGGERVHVGDRIHPDNVALCQTIAKVFPLDSIGIDLIISDISQSWKEVGCAINEVNAIPQLGAIIEGLYRNFLARYVRQDSKVVVSISNRPKQEGEFTTLMSLMDRSLPAMRIDMSVREVFSQGIPVSRFDALVIDDYDTEASALVQALAFVIGHLQGPVLVALDHPHYETIRRGLASAEIREFPDRAALESEINMTLFTQGDSCSNS